ncbi:hypothetical protein ACHAWX_004389 [Stephanocyclus meneghinianus]
MASPRSTNNNERRLPEEWSDIFYGFNESFSSDHARALFPQLTSAAHKGSHGRIAIFGGSDKYTGAPYYAASAALKCGVDLVTVFCAKEASIPIKCYSPELMEDMFYLFAILEKAMECKLALVLDADALYMLSLEEYKDILEKLMSYENVVMTPNLMESKRLKEALRKYRNKQGCTDDDAWNNASIIVQKGSTDLVSQKYITLKCNEKGGLKRCGGIGDVLAGTISAFVALHTILQKSGRGNDYVARKIENQMFAVWIACCTVKKATHKAFNRKRRAMSAQHVLEEISEVISEIEQNLENSG